MGQAIADFYKTRKNKKIAVLSDIAEKEYINSSYLFRTYDEMPELEQLALQSVKGKVLDIGAAAGCHAIYLQNVGYHITALEQSELACKTMKAAGVKNVINSRIEEYNAHNYDTVLLLMNGIGIAGYLNKLPSFINHLQTLLKPGGQIIFDSCDIKYLYMLDDGSELINLNQLYYGELTYQMKYKSHMSEKFPWLFVDAETLQEQIKKLGNNLEFISKTDTGQYLARVTH